jgi:hypothetical protein
MSRPTTWPYALVMAALCLLAGLLLWDAASAASVWQSARHQRAEDWWEFANPITPGGSFTEAIAMMPQNPSWLEGFVGITVGLGAREAAGRQVGELVAPSGPNVLIATTEDGVKVAPGLGYTDDMVGGNLVREDYEPILPTETIQRFWDEERVEQLGFGVWAVRADEPEERLVLHRDFTGSHILIVPRSLSPIGGGE